MCSREAQGVSHITLFLASTSNFAQCGACKVEKKMVGVGSGRAWELRGLPTAGIVPCPLQVPEGHSLSGRRKLTSCSQYPTGSLGWSQRPGPQPSLRTTTPTLGDPLPITWLLRVGAGCVHQCPNPLRPGLDLGKTGTESKFQPRGTCSLFHSCFHEKFRQ